MPKRETIKMSGKVAVTIKEHFLYEESLRCAKEAGFRYVNMGFGSSTDLFLSGDWERKIEKIASDLQKNGLRAVNTHAPYYDLCVSSEKCDEKIDLAQKRCLKATKILGADVCAFHAKTRFTGGENLDVSFEDNKRNFAPLVDEAIKSGVKVGIENLPKFPEWEPVFFTCYTSDQIRLIDYFNAPEAVCAVWDTGHANLMNYDQAQAIEKVGKRIKATHLHNNFKTEDYHLAPSVGTIDWDSVCKAFKKIGYDGYFTAETDLYDSLLTEQYVKHLYGCLIKIEKIFD